MSYKSREKEKRHRHYYHHQHKEKINAGHRKRDKTKRLLVLAHYGNKCVCCGEFRTEFLGIDHIKGNGNKHRQEIGGGSRLVRWIIKNNFPKNLQILCHNCNLAKGFYGYCPHEKERLL